MERIDGRLEAIRKAEHEYAVRRAQAKAVIDVHEALGKPLAEKIPVIRSLTREIRERLEADALSNAGRAPEPRDRGLIAEHFRDNAIIADATAAIRHSARVNGA